MNGAIQTVRFFMLNVSFAPLLLERKANKTRKLAPAPTDEKGASSYLTTATYRPNASRHAAKDLWDFCSWRSNVSTTTLWPNLRHTYFRMK